MVRQVDDGSGKCQLCGAAFDWRRLKFAWAWPFVLRPKFRLCPGGLCDHEVLCGVMDIPLANFCPTCAASVKRPCAHTWGVNEGGVEVCQVAACGVAKPKPAEGGA
jgi:hypothetical protein